MFPRVAFLLLPMVCTGSAEPQSTAPAPEDKAAAVGSFRLEQSKDGFGVRSHGVIERTASGPRFYPLPQSSFATYEKLGGSKRVFPARTEKTYQRQEVIGPHQVESDRIWFGNQYYDGEGYSGVGAFGYFDTTTRKYLLFSPPEIARWEISALLVEPDAVWLALGSFGEDPYRFPGGLLRWSRSDHQLQRYPLEFVVVHIRLDSKDPSSLVLTAHGGYALFRNGEVERYRFEKSPAGRDVAVRISRFPRPGSIQ
jgi:hypothetical protein